MVVLPPPPTALMPTTLADFMFQATLQSAVCRLAFQRSQDSLGVRLRLNDIFKPYHNGEAGIDPQILQLRQHSSPYAFDFERPGLKCHNRQQDAALLKAIKDHLDSRVHL